MKDLISFSDWSSDELLHLLDLADELKAKQRAGVPHKILEGKTLAMIFEKPSLRTRVTFQTGIFQLGGTSVLIDTLLGKRESVPDVAHNLERWVEGIMARTYAHEHVVELAQHSRVPVINALTDKLHPCQILADAQALREYVGKDLSSIKVAFVGDGNNVFNSWAELAAKLPFNLTLVCPEGYEPDATIFTESEREAKGELHITNDIETGMRDADVVYTDVWASMGQEDEEAERGAIFAPYQVNERLMSMAKRNALFMHCLPAHRGSEVTDAVMDAPTSIVFDQAENRLHAQKAVMAVLMGGA